MLQRRQGYGAVSGQLQKGAKGVKEHVDNRAQGLTSGQVIGVVFAAILFFVLFIATTWWCCVRSARRRDERKLHEAEMASVLGEEEGTTAHKHRSQPLTRQDAISTLPMAQLESTHTHEGESEHHAAETSGWSQHEHGSQATHSQHHYLPEPSRWSAHGHGSEATRSQQELLPQHAPPPYEDSNPFRGALRNNYDRPYQHSANI